MIKNIISSFLYIIDRKKSLKTKEIKEVAQKRKIVIIPTPKSFDLLERFIKGKKDVTAMKYISKLNPKYGIPEVLSRDLLRVFRKSYTISNDDLCYFVERVIKCTLMNRNSGRITTINFIMKMG